MAAGDCVARPGVGRPGVGRPGVGRLHALQPLGGVAHRWPLCRIPREQRLDRPGLLGELRGGVLADDPGLGKTVTVLALVVRAPPPPRNSRRAIRRAILRRSSFLCSAQVHSAGAFPSMPAEFWNTEGGWIQLRTNPVGHRSLLRVLNPISRELHAPTDSDRAEGRNFAPYLNPAGLRDFEERLRPLLAFANSGGDPQLRIFPTLDSFSRALDGVIRAAVRARGATADGA